LPNQTSTTSSINGSKISKDGNEIHEENDAVAKCNKAQQENIENARKSTSNCDDIPKMSNNTSAVDEPCLNGEGMKKTRKNGVYAHAETIPNGRATEV
jgi:hypothetical protein